LKPLVKFFFFFSTVFYLQTVYTQNFEDAPYLKGQILVKIHTQHAEKCTKSKIAIPEITQFIQETKVNSIEKLFPNHESIDKSKSENKNKVDLSTIYRFKFDPSIPVKKILNQIQKLPAVDYAEKEYLNRLTYTPNDTLNIRQWYLGAIDAYRAWDIEKGDSSVVIAIVDTGSDTAHADLISSFALNHDDPINGIDDDGDGYTDNFYGWDIANNDNDPSFSISGHGTNVASIAAASTDNITGISGVGFNARILSVRIDDENTGQLTAAFEGIVYAADQGAFIINNSWGSFSFSQVGQDIVNYAAINKGALVVGAAGNGPFSGPNAGIGTEAPFYPAAYENVLSVGSLLEGDTIKASSNFGYWLDIFAPGEDMLTARENNSYGISGGTSMAAPVISGVAALIKSHFPELNAKQVAQKMLSTADQVDAINAAKFQGKMGVGRVNAFRALSDTLSPGIDFENKQISDGNDEVFAPGDTLRISGDFINYLAPSSNVQASLTPLNKGVEVIGDKINLGQIETLGSRSNQNKPFLAVIKPEIGFNQKVTFEVRISANNGSYLRKTHFNLELNPDFLTVNKNKLTVTLASNGSIGFSGSDNQLGEGIKFLSGNSLLFDGSFMLGNSANFVMDRYRNQNGMDRDFEIEEAVRAVSATQSAFQASASFKNKKEGEPPKVSITQQNFVFDRPSLNKSIIYVYRIENISSSLLTNLHAGMIMDWDIVNFDKNKINNDQQRRMGISFATDTNIFIGLQALNDELNYFHYAIDNTQNGRGGVNITDGFSEAEKFQVLSNNRMQAGMSSAEGNDILDVVSMGPFSLEPDSIKFISFAVSVSENMNELLQESDSLKDVFQSLVLSIEELPKISGNEMRVFPNPANQEVNVELKLLNPEKINFKIMDLKGGLIYENDQFYGEGEHNITLSTSSWKTGLYLLEVKGESFTKKNNFVVFH